MERNYIDLNRVIIVYHRADDNERSQLVNSILQKVGDVSVFSYSLQDLSVYSSLPDIVKDTNYVLITLLSKNFDVVFNESENKFKGLSDSYNTMYARCYFEIEESSLKATFLKDFWTLNPPKENIENYSRYNEFSYDYAAGAIASIVEVANNESVNQIIKKTAIEEFPQLTLVGLRLNRIPYAIRFMPYIETLILASNNISEIQYLDELRNLKFLYLQRNFISKIENISSIKLSALDLSENSIENIEGLNDSIMMLRLSGNKIKNIDFANNFKRLVELDIANNLVESIENLSAFSELFNILELSGNPITSIKPLLPLIERGVAVYNIKPSDKVTVKIVLEGCSNISEPPLEVIGQGNEAIINYFKEAEIVNTKKLELFKLILVGNSRVGKTDFSQFLRIGTVQENSVSTHLLDIQQYEADFLKSESGTYTHINIFDFGGQDYYHDAHRMFYSHDTAYVLLWDADTNKHSEKNEPAKDGTGEIFYEDFPLEYWLESIKYNLDSTTAANYYKNEKQVSTANTINNSLAPVLVIQNKIDIAEAMLDQQRLQTCYPNIRCFFNVSLTQKKRTDVLKQVLSDYLYSLNLSGRLLLTYEHQLVEYFREACKEPLEIIDLQEFHKRCIDQKFITADRFIITNAEILAQILNNIGVLFYDKTTEGGAIYTNIKELNDRIKQIMDVARKGSDKGVFEKADLASIISHDKILPLLGKNNSIIALKNDFYIAPQFLPVKAEGPVLFFIEAFIYAQVRYVYKAYFHKSLLLNLFAAYIDGEKLDISEIGIKSFPFWRNGIIIKKDKSVNKEWVYISFEKDADMKVGIVSIRTMRPYSKTGLEAEVEKKLDELNKGWTCDKQVSIDSRNYFSLEEMKKDVKEKKKYLFYSEDSKTYSINDFKSIADFEKLPKKLFISYSSRNSDYVSRFVTHLEVLRAKGEIESWYDRMITPGTRWDDSIRREMASSDAVIFLLSPEFLATEYIMNVEVPNAMKMFSEKIVTLFPIQLKTCYWEETDLANLQQTGNAKETWKNIITIEKYDNDAQWIESIKALKKVLGIIKTEETTPIDISNGMVP